MIWIIAFILTLITTAVVVDGSSLMFLVFIYLIGISICYVFGGKEKKSIIKIFHAVFTIGSIYMLMTFLFMSENNYPSLLSYDAGSYFIPTTKQYMAEGSYWLTLSNIWEKYNFFNRFQSGYFTYATFFGYMSNSFGANFYLGQQISVLILFSFVGVIIYNLFKINSFSNEKAFKFTLITCTFSILFFYSSQILRDTHILLLYLIGIYLTFKKDFSILNLLKIFIIIYLCTTFRLESGLFMVILIPIYLLLSMQRSRMKFVVVGISIIVGIAAVYISVRFLQDISSVVEANQEAYGDDKGSGIIGTFQEIPLAGDLASIFYNAVQPVPLWSRFSITSGSINDKAVYNIMNFPRSFASFFNWMVSIYVLAWLFSKDIREKTKIYISKPLVYQLWIGLIFLLLQSAVISQRRLMPYYVIFYILFFIIYNSTPHKIKTYINFLVFFGFLMLQIVGIMILS